MPQAYLVEVQTKQTSIGPMYDLVFDNGEKVGAGKFKPKGAEAGKYYSYEVKMNGNYKNLAPGSLRQVVAPPATSPQAQAAPARAANGGGFDARQDTISKQAAFNTALTLVKILQDADALPVAASAKKANKADAIEAIVMEYAAKFYKRATGNTMELDEEAQDAADLAAVDMDTSWDE